ncbi:MAG: hypothetical protein ACRC18_06425 [Cetobacterium sp.]
MDKLEVKWTGSYPCLCSGEWIIKYNGMELDVPKEHRNSHMNTYGEYDSLQDYITEEFIQDSDGLEYDEWINENKHWVVKMFEEKQIEVTDELLLDLYEFIRNNDFRSGSCGGCI